MNILLLQVEGWQTRRINRPSIRRAWSLAGILLLIISLSGPASRVGATAYFVDFSAGSDSNNGQSTSTPWRHAPTDSNATGVPAGASFSAGDVVNFKGGGGFNGALGLVNSADPWNGTAGNPVTFQSATNWGTGQAIFDGTYNGGNTTNGTAFLLGYGGGEPTTPASAVLKSAITVTPRC